MRQKTLPSPNVEDHPFEIAIKHYVAASWAVKSYLAATSIVTPMRPVLAALLLMLLAPASAHASCATMHALAQEHANDMARRGSMDHTGFGARARRGARAENVAYGVRTKQQAIALWWGSSGHAANMRLPGCKAVASAVGRNGTRYWVMVIGN